MARSKNKKRTTPSRTTPARTSSRHSTRSNSAKTNKASSQKETTVSKAKPDPPPPQTATAGAATYEDSDRSDTSEVQLVKDSTPKKSSATSTKSQNSGSDTHESPSSTNTQKVTYASILTHTSNTPTIRNPNERSNTFLLAKEYNDHPDRFRKENNIILLSNTGENEDDDATATMENLSTMRRQRFKVNIGIGKADTGVTRESAPTIAIEKLNTMLKVLSNKHEGIKCIPWMIDTDSEISSQDMFSELPTTDFDFCEQKIHGFNRFASPGSFLKLRVHIAYPASTPLASILETTSSFFISREQRFEIAPSDANQPFPAGTLTGSVQDMSTSKDFFYTFKNLFYLKDLGLTWEFPSNSGQVKYTPKMCKIHVEINLSDKDKLNEMEKFFNNSSSSLNRTFLGTPMTLVPIQDRNLAQEVQDRIIKHCNIQGDLGKGLETTVQHGFALNNWYDKPKKITLYEKLMSLESITEKVMGHGIKKRKFFGRLFYAIVYSKASHKTTFYYLPSNRKEARSVALGLALVIRDEFDMDPTFYCSGDKVKEAEDGFWNKSTRTFLTKFEKEDEDRLEFMKDSLTAKPATTEFISKEHARAMATDKDIDIDEDTILTKGSAAPKRHGKAQNDQVVEVDSPDGSLSTMTGSTRTSKAKRFASAQVLEAQKEFLKGQAVMQKQMLEKDNALLEKDARLADLMARLERLENSSSQPQTVQVPETPAPASPSDLSNKSSQSQVMMEDTNSTEDDPDKAQSKPNDDTNMEVDYLAPAPSPTRRRKGDKNSTYIAGERSNAKEHTSKHIAIDDTDDESAQVPTITITVGEVSTSLDPTTIPLPPDAESLLELDTLNQIHEPPDGSTEGGKGP